MRTILFLAIAVAVIGLVGWNYFDDKRDEAITQIADILIDYERLVHSTHALELQIIADAGGVLPVPVWEAETTGSASALVQAALGELSQQNSMPLRSHRRHFRMAYSARAESSRLRIEGEAPLDAVLGLLRGMSEFEPHSSFNELPCDRLSASTPRPAQPMMLLQADIAAPLSGIAP